MKQYIVYSITNPELYCAFVNDSVQEFKDALTQGKIAYISKNEFSSREEAESFGRQLAYYGCGIPLCACDEDNSVYVEAIEKFAYVI